MKAGSKLLFALTIVVATGAASGLARFAYERDQVSKQKRTKGILLQIWLALDAYRYYNLEYPIAHYSCDYQPASEPWCTIEEIGHLLDVYYKGGCPRLDGWGNPVRIASSGFVCKIWSQGRDGKDDRGYGGGWQRGFDADIGVVNGSFWSAPEGWDAVYGQLPYVFGARQRGADTRESLRRIFRAATDGDPSAQFQLGVSHLFGIDLVKDEIDASKWLHNAANKGHAGAQSMLDFASTMMTRHGTSLSRGSSAIWSMYARGRTLT